MGRIMNIFVLVSQASLRTKCQDQEPPSNIGRLVVDGDWRQGLALAGWGDHTTHMSHQKVCKDLNTVIHFCSQIGYKLR